MLDLPLFGNNQLSWITFITLWFAWNDLILVLCVKLGIQIVEVCVYEAQAQAQADQLDGWQRCIQCIIWQLIYIS